MTRRKRAQGIVVTRRQMEAYLAAHETHLIRAEQLSQVYETLVIEPGDKDMWFIPQVYALHEDS